MILYGSSGHAKVIIDSLRKLGESYILMVDDDPKINEIVS